MCVVDFEKWRRDTGRNVSRRQGGRGEAKLWPRQGQTELQPIGEVIEGLLQKIRGR